MILASKFEQDREQVQPEANASEVRGRPMNMPRPRVDGQRYSGEIIEKKGKYYFELDEPYEFVSESGLKCRIKQIALQPTEKVVKIYRSCREAYVTYRSLRNLADGMDCCLMQED